MTLYASDLDGTLLRSDMSLSEKTIVTLNRLMADGVLFTYSTARSWSSASPLLQKLELTCPAVTFNGVFVVDPKTGEHIAENVFPGESFDKAKKFITDNQLAPLVYSHIDGRERVSFLSDMTDAVRGYVEMRKGDKRLRPAADYKELFEGRAFYITLLNPAVCEKTLSEIFCGDNGFAHNSMYDTYDKNILWYEIYSASASKANAVKQVKTLVGADELVCFGDNRNDLSMILAADTGAAVSNADELLKSHSDIIIGSNDEDAVAEFILRREGASRKGSFSRALDAAMLRERGIHGSVGTQNEKPIHAALKAYYAPFSDEQEIKIGRFYADAVNENGIIEIQTRALFRLRDKLRVFCEAAAVTVVHPVEAETRTVYINSGTGEVVKETPFRKAVGRVKIFKELYSLREFIKKRSITVILAYLKTEKRVYIDGTDIPDLRSKSVRKKLLIEKIPLELLREQRLADAPDYAAWLPEGLPASFTKKDFCAAAKESEASLRLEVLREAGVIEQTGKQGSRYVYSVRSVECGEAVNGGNED